MKPIVYIVNNYHPLYKLPLLRVLSRDTELDYYFFSGLEADIPIRVMDEDVLIKNLPNWKKLKNYWLLNKRFLWQKGLLHPVTYGNYDCIVFLANPYYLTNWIGILIARLRRKKIFLWGHFILRNSWLDPIKTFFYKLVDGYLLYGNWAKEQLITRGFDPDKLFVIYNSLDYERQIECRRNLTPEKRKNRRQALFNYADLPVLLFVGRLTRRKKLHQLIEATERLHENNEKVNLLLVGDGEEKAYLLNLVNHSGLKDYVIFWGETYDEAELSELISLSDVCVSPGDVGLTAIHALMYGTPVITHNNPYAQGPEYESIIPGITGVLFDQDSIVQLTDTISTWINKKKNLRELIRLECYKIVDDHYNPDYQALVLRNSVHILLKDL